MKANYKEHLLETVESIYRTLDPNASTGVIYARMFGALSAVVTTEQLELLLKCALDTALSQRLGSVVEVITEK